MRTKTMMMAGALAVLTILASACSIDIERNADGSLRIDSVLTADSFAAELERDPLNNDTQISIQDGVMTMTVEGVEETGEEYVATLLVDLGVRDGRLFVDITEADYNGYDVPKWIVDEYNKAIERAIRVGAEDDPNTTLVSLVADNDQIVTEWRVEDRPRS